MLDSFKLKAFADDKFNVAKKVIFVCNMVEKIVGKGEMLVTSIFSFPSVFKRLLFLGRLKVRIACGKELMHNPDFTQTRRKRAFENIVGMGENTSFQHFLHFPYCFLSIKGKKNLQLNSFYFVICKCFQFVPT